MTVFYIEYTFQWMQNIILDSFCDMNLPFVGRNVIMRCSECAYARDVDSLGPVINTKCVYPSYIIQHLGESVNSGPEDL